MPNKGVGSRWAALAATVVMLGCGGAQPAASAPTTPDSALLEDDAPSAQSPDFEQGVAAIRDQKFEVARGHFEKAVAAEPRNAQAHFYLGVAQQNLEQLPAAQASYQKAAELQPKLADAWVNWTATLLDAGDAQAALPVIE